MAPRFVAEPLSCTRNPPPRLYDSSKTRSLKFYSAKHNKVRGRQDGGLWLRSRAAAGAAGLVKKFWRVSGPASSSPFERRQSAPGQGDREGRNLKRRNEPDPERSVGLRELNTALSDEGAFYLTIERKVVAAPVHQHQPARKNRKRILRRPSLALYRGIVCRISRLVRCGFGLRFFAARA